MVPVTAALCQPGADNEAIIPLVPVMRVMRGRGAPAGNSRE